MYDFNLSPESLCWHRVAGNSLSVILDSVWVVSFPLVRLRFCYFRGRTAPRKLLCGRLLFCVQGNVKYTLLNLNKGPGDWKIPETLNLC